MERRTQINFRTFLEIRELYDEYLAGTKCANHALDFQLFCLDN